MIQISIEDHDDRRRAGSGRPADPPAAAPALAVAASSHRCCRLRHKRDSITVGAVPDDYRTNHPIVIAEKDQMIDLPVGAGERGMTRFAARRADGFLDGYDRSAAPGADDRGRRSARPTRSRRPPTATRFRQFLRSPRHAAESGS